MLLTHCLNVLEGEVPDVYLSGLNEFVKVVPIGFPPLPTKYCIFKLNLLIMKRGGHS